VGRIELLIYLCYVNSCGQIDVIPEVGQVNKYFGHREHFVNFPGVQLKILNLRQTSFLVIGTDLFGFGHNFVS
jgi:hypothetical protein